MGSRPGGGGSSPISITNFNIFSDQAYTNPVTSLDNNTTYYANIAVANGGAGEAFSLTCDDGNIAVTDLDGNGNYSVAVGDDAAGSADFYASVSYNGNESTADLSLATSGQNPGAPISISSIIVSLDQLGAIPITIINNNTTYYANVVVEGGGGSQTTDTFTLGSDNEFVVVTDLGLGNGSFSLTVTGPAPETLNLFASATFNNLTAYNTVQLPLSGQAQITVSSINVYSDSACTQQVTSVDNGPTYYVNIIPAGGGTAPGDVCGCSLSCTNSDIAIVASGTGSASDFTLVATGASAGVIQFTATVEWGNNTSALYNQNITFTGTNVSVPAPVTVSSITVFADSACTIPAALLNNSTTYYARVVPGGAGSQLGDTYTLTSSNAGVVVINNLGAGVFQINVGTPTGSTANLTATATYNGNASANSVQAVTLSNQAQISVTLGIFSDAGCTIPATVFNNGVMYYGLITPSNGGGSQNGDTYTLTSSNAGVTVSASGNGLYTLNVGTPAAGSVTLTANASFAGNTSANVIQTATLTGQPQVNVGAISFFTNYGCTIPAIQLNNNTTYYAQITPSGGGGSQVLNGYSLTSNNSNITTNNLGNGIFNVVIGTTSVGTAVFTATTSYGGNTSANGTKSIATSGYSSAPVSNIRQVVSLVQFTRGTSLVWEALTTPIPAGVVTFSIDDGVFKLGDGATPYAALPTLFTFSQLVAAQGGSNSLFDQPSSAQNGNVVVIAFEESTGTLMYSISTTSLASILSSISSLQATNTSQDAEIASLMAIALSIDASINTGNTGDLVVINNGRYSDSGVTVAQVQAEVAAGAAYTPGSHVMEPVFYTTSSLEIVANQMTLYDGDTYYADVIGFNNNVATPVFGLVCSNPKVTVTNITGSLFSVKFAGVCGTLEDRLPVVLVASVDDGTGNATVKKAIVVQVLRTRMLECIYGGGSVDQYTGVAIDSYSNIICCGSTKSEGQGNSDCLVVKFDPNFNILASQIYGGTNADSFNGVAVDASGNIICAGATSSEGQGSASCLVIKFDTNLNILIKKIYGGSVNDYFQAVTVDSAGDIICAGVTYSEGAAGDALVVKFDTNLNILYRMHVGGSGLDCFQAVTVDSNNNVYCAGNTKSAGLGGTTYGDAFVAKFDVNLNLLEQATYGGSHDDVFFGVAVDASGNVICAGMTYSEGSGSPTNYHALVVKFSSSLSINDRVVSSAAGSDSFTGVVVNSVGNIVCAGYTYAEGPGYPTYSDCIVVEFDGNLNVLEKKDYGAANNETFRDVAIDINGNIVCVGTGTSALSNLNCLAFKTPPTIPSGTFVGTLLTNLILSDSSFSTVPSTLTLTASTLTGTASTLTLTNSSLTSSASTLTIEGDVLN